jgi:hypothetical protein
MIDFVLLDGRRVSICLPSPGRRRVATDAHHHLGDSVNPLGGYQA